MKRWLCFLTLIVIFVTPFVNFGQNCNNCAKITSSVSGIQIGDLDIPGDQITVEATFNRTEPYVGSQLYAGDLVSKHDGPTNTNYLLRPNSAEITTTNGYFKTPDICDIQLNKTYHAAMVYDGKELKFYRNGFLMSSIPCSGNLYQNDFITAIGTIASHPTTTNENLIGYINDVRIWNVARTQSDIKKYMNQSLPNPASQTGLLAYYMFDDLKNKQGNTQWNGSILGNAAINQSNPTCSSFVADSCATKSECDSWGKFTGVDPGVQIGDLDISGDQITVEALCNRDVAFDPIFYGGDIVSKHTDPSDVNYLLRPTVAEITTTSGFHITPDVCQFQLNKTYHVALVYDGKELKFYRNGFLMSKVACTGNLIQNDWLTRIGSTAAPPDMNPSEFHGYINEVRIWNVARTQKEIRDYMNQSLPNPSTQNGLLAYYIFDDLKNKQGNPQWDGSLLNNASINQTNPNCDFIADSCAIICDLDAGFSYQQNTCNPKTIELHNQTANADSTWWNFGDGQTAGTIEDPVIQYSDYGQYIVHLYAKTNAGCLDTATETISVSIQKDSAIINNDTSICAGSSIQLNAISGINYCWSPSINLSDSSIQSPVAYPKVTTTYYLNILTENNQPVKRDSIIITVLSVPVVNAGEDDSACKGSSVQLNATSAITYNWNASPALSDTTIANPVATPVNTTEFIVTGYNTQGCSDKDTVKIIVLPLPVITLTNDTAVCTGGSILLQANAAGNNIYSWSPAVGLSNPNIFNPIATPADTTKYYVTVNDNNSCKSVDSVMVNVLNIPAVSTINDTAICQGKTIVLLTTTSYADIFNWSPQNGLNDPAVKNPNASPLTTTLYKISASNGICSKEDSVLVTVLSLPLITASNDTTICGKASVQLNASGGISYKWNPVAGLSNPGISNPVASPVSTTIYYVTGTGNNSCMNTDSTTVTVQPVPVFTLSPQNASLCFADSVMLMASGGDIYNWSPAQTVSNPSSDVTKVFPSVNTTYKVIITNSICKITDSLTADVVIKDLPAVTISKSNDIDCINFEAQLVATGGINYKWSPSTFINNTQINNPAVNPPADTWYSVVVNGTNSCSNKDSILVKSLFNPDAVSFEIASAFTPNHDGLNDCFSVKYWGPADLFDMSIYNRWGQLVYHSNNVNSCWDGTFKGQPQATGTYIYKINVSAKCSGGLIHKKGTLVLIR